MSQIHSLLKARRFLIAEDETLIAMLLEQAIEDEGGVIAAVVDSCTLALAALEAEQLDAVILDVQLRDGSSENVISLAGSKGVPVLICTGSDPRSLPVPFQGLPVLRKPWRQADMLAALAELLDGQV